MEIVAVAPPARGRRPAALRPTVEPAYRTQSTSRMAAGTVIYGISGDAVFRIRNTHGDSTPRPAAGAVIYGIFGDVATEIGNTREDSTPRAAKR